MRVRILRRMLGHVNGISLRHYRPNEVYEVPPSIANYLVAQGVATFEMRNPDGQAAPPDRPDRRRRKP